MAYRSRGFEQARRHILPELHIAGIVSEQSHFNAPKATMSPALSTISSPDSTVAELSVTANTFSL